MATTPPQPRAAGAVVRSGSSTTLPRNSSGGGPVIGGRVRSTSPCKYRGGSLADDMRRIASLLDPAPPGGRAANASMNVSLSSSPQSAWEPGDRGGAPISSGATPSRSVAMQQQVAILEDRLTSSFNASLAGLRQQGESDRRRLGQLERKLDTRLEDRPREDEAREKWAEIRGSVNGLMEEMQALTKRVEGLDERLWARTSGAELAKQRNRELEQQVQALEQQARLNSAAMDEASKRQATKTRRTEHMLEETTRRLATVEEELHLRQQQAPQWDEYMEARISNMESQQERLDVDFSRFQLQLDECMQGLQSRDQNGQDGALTVEDAMSATERGLATVKKEIMGQVEDLASSISGLKVKSESQVQRLMALADRMEKAHEPTMESFHAEIAQLRRQDRREVDAEVAALRHRVQETSEASDEAVAEVREALRQTSAEIAALRLRPEENSVLRNLDERLGAQEQETLDLRGRLEALPPSEAEASPVNEETARMHAEDEVEDLRRRLEWLEEQSALGAAADKRHTQNTICELKESMGRLKQQASWCESTTASLQQQLQQMQGTLERRLTEDTVGASRLPAEEEARVKEMWDKVAELHARLLEVEGGLDFARESAALHLHEASAVSVASEPSSVLHPDRRAEVLGRPVLPLPRGMGETERDCGIYGADASPVTPVHEQGSAQEREQASLDMREKLEAVAEHLETMDELMDRVAELEKRAATTEPEALCDMTSPAKASEVSFGGDAPISEAKEAASHAGALVSAGVQTRLVASEQELNELSERVALLQKQISEDRNKEQQKSAEAGQGQQELKELSEQVVLLQKRFSEDRNKEQQKSAEAGQGQQEQQRWREEVMAELQSQVAASEQNWTALREDLLKQESLGQELKTSSEAQSKAHDLLSQQVAALREGVLQDSHDMVDSTRQAAEKAAKELRAELQQLREEVAPSAGRALELDRVRLEVVKLSTDMRENGEAVASLKEEVAATRALELDKVRLEVGQLGASMHENKATLNSLRELVPVHETSLKELRAKLDAQDSSKPGNGLLDSFADRLQGLEGRVAAVLSGSGASAHDDLEQRLQRLEECSAAGGSATAAALSADKEARLEVQMDVEQLRAKLENELDGLLQHQKGLVDTRCVLDQLSKDVDSLRNKPEQGKDAVPQDGKSLVEVCEELGGLREQMKAVEVGMASLREQQMLDELKEQMADMKGSVAMLQEQRHLAELREQVLGQEKRLQGVEAGFTVLQEVPPVERKAVEELQERVEKLGSSIAQQKEVLSRSPVDVGPEVAERFRALEERLTAAEAGAEGQATPAAAADPGTGDEEVRLQVQEQMEALTRQLTQELGSLARHQEGLTAARASFEALAAAGTAPSSGTADEGSREAIAEVHEALGTLREQVEMVLRQLKAAEDAMGLMRRDVEQLQGTRKVGISLEDDGDSPMADVRKRLNALTEQVSELQHHRVSAAPKHRNSPPWQESSREASLNFSLTEQMVADGSLNFSLTESKRDFSLQELPAEAAGGGKARRRSAAEVAAAGADAVETVGSTSGSPQSVASADSQETDSAKGRRHRDCLASPGIDDSGQGSAKPNGGDGGSGGGDILDGLMGATGCPKGGRPRPSPLKMEGEERGAALAPVAEEESSDEEHASQRPRPQEHGLEAQKQLLPRKSSKGRAHSPLECGSVESPGSSLDNSRSNLEISQSCNEVSAGVDYSVEDSTELDQCDFIEPVAPHIHERKVRSSTSPAFSRSLSSSAGLGLGTRGSLGSPAGLGAGLGGVGFSPATLGGAPLVLGRGASGRSSGGSSPAGLGGSGGSAGLLGTGAVRGSAGGSPAGLGGSGGGSLGGANSPAGLGGSGSSVGSVGGGAGGLGSGSPTGPAGGSPAGRGVGSLLEGTSAGVGVGQSLAGRTTIEPSTPVGTAAKEPATVEQTSPSAGASLGAPAGSEDALDAMVGKPSPAEGATAAASLEPPPPKASLKQMPADGENEYGEESFEENGSVSESIEESVEGSGGSNAWGEDEDV